MGPTGDVNVGLYIYIYVFIVIVTPSDVIWFINPMKTIVIRCYLRTINHSEIEVM